MKGRPTPWALAAFAAVVLTCGPRPDATVAPGSEQIPGPSYFHIV